MTLPDAMQTDLLELIFQNVALAGLGDSGGLLGSSTAGSLYMALHTSSPGAGGTQSTNECSYAGYARVAIARSSSGWTVSGSPAAASNTAQFTFPTCTSGSETASHISVGVASSGATKLLYSGALTGSLSISTGKVPTFAAGGFSTKMGGAATTFANELAKHVFQNVAIADIGDSSGLRASATAGSIYVALHTATPAAGDQTTSAATFGSYARVAIARSSAGWTVSGADSSNTAHLVFPKATSTGSNVITYLSLGVALSGTSRILWFGAMPSNWTVALDDVINWAPARLVAAIG